MSIEKILENALSFEICNNCLGRQFGQLLTGYSNRERGVLFRETAAFLLDSSQIDTKNINLSNFYGHVFQKNKMLSETEIPRPKHCHVCNDLFSEPKMEKLAKLIDTSVKKYEFKSFLVGSKLSKDLLDREERLWEKTGIEFCEPIRAEINRELGKLLEFRWKKHADLKKPEIAIIMNLEKNKVELNINPLFISGGYKKLKRGIPQCMWGTPEKYSTSVEEEVGRPTLRITSGTNHKFHGAGREDIDALCLDWRPFVIEITEPRKRNLKLKDLEKLINKSKKAQVSNLKISNMNTVRYIKSMRADKTYRAQIKLGKSITKSDLRKLKKLKGKIEQKTPTRVMHRRADLNRKREIKSINFRFINSKTLEMIVRGTAGTYIKELVSGDNGRTVPSVSGILETSAEVEQLDVIKFHRVK